MFEREAEVPEEGAIEPVKEGLSFKLWRTSSKLQRKKERKSTSWRSGPEQAQNSLELLLGRIGEQKLIQKAK